MRRFAASLTAVVIGALSAGQVRAGTLVLDTDTTVDFRVNGSVQVVDGVDPPTVVNILAPADIEDDIVAYGSSIVNVLGGSNDRYLLAYDSSVVYWRGGRLDNGVKAYDTSTIHVYGFGLQIIEDRFLGTLADGLTLDGRQAQTFDGGRIVLHEVPEPSTLASLLAAGVVCLSRARRRRRSPALYGISRA